MAQGVVELVDRLEEVDSPDLVEQVLDDRRDAHARWLLKLSQAWRRLMSASPGRGNRRPGIVPDADFVVVLSQGRTGSTLILRMLNATPGVRLCGENDRAFDRLKAFVDCFQTAADRQSSEFYKWAWLLPCDRAELIEKMRAFVMSLYNPGGEYRVVGFKEIRYARLDLRPEIDKDLAFLRELFPSLRVIFSVRRTEDCVKSAWWAEDPEASAVTLERMRATFRKYHESNRDHCYWMPYEELREGSAVLQGMFAFLGLPWTGAAMRELRIRLRE